MNKFKSFLSIFFFVFGLICAILTFSLINKDSLGYVKDNPERYAEPSNIGAGVDSANDGVAIGFGLISGFSFLSSVLLINSNNKKDIL